MKGGFCFLFIGGSKSNALTRFSDTKSRVTSFTEKWFGSRRSEVGKTENVVSVLNPYKSSRNMGLVLDLIACRAGIGVALKLLAFLEVDVQNNWKPFKPQASFVP